MASIHQHSLSQQPTDNVAPADYHEILRNFRIAHDIVERQRKQLEDQERLVADLKERIASLEGRGLGQKAPSLSQQGSTTSMDDVSVLHSAARLDKLITRWIAGLMRSLPTPVATICEAILNDVTSVHTTSPFNPDSAIVAQALLRHAMAEAITDGFINCLVVCNSQEANIHLTRIHEHLFTRDPTLASVWRRQTFSAAVESCTPEMLENMFAEHAPNLLEAIRDQLLSPSPNGGLAILQSSFEFSRVLHGASSSTMDACYRAYVPEIGSPLNPSQVELIKRCVKSESGTVDRIGAITFPGLVKVTRGSGGLGNAVKDIHTIVKRAQAICECALTGP